LIDIRVKNDRPARPRRIVGDEYVTIDIETGTGHMQMVVLNDGKFTIAMPNEDGLLVPVADGDMGAGAVHLRNNGQDAHTGWRNNAIPA
jgi:hypothetical protein